MSNPAIPKSEISIDHPRIVKTPGTCGGKPRIDGHRIRVQDIVIWHERQGMTPEEIVDEYPGLTKEDVSSALAYFADHREEIENLLESGDALAEEISKEEKSVLVHPPGKLDAKGNPLSSR